MPATRLEHVNITVKDPQATAAWMARVFDWKIRWEGPGMQSGYTIHIGSDDTYLALFSFGDTSQTKQDRYRTSGAMNHVALVVDDLDAMEARVIAEGYAPDSHADYEPGRRFYFHDENDIEFELVEYA